MTNLWIIIPLQHWNFNYKSTVVFASYGKSFRLLIGSSVISLCHHVKMSQTARPRPPWKKSGILILQLSITLCEKKCPVICDTGSAVLKMKVMRNFVLNCWRTCHIILPFSSAPVPSLFFCCNSNVNIGWNIYWIKLARSGFPKWFQQRSIRKQLSLQNTSVQGNKTLRGYSV